MIMSTANYTPVSYTDIWKHTACSTLSTRYKLIDNFNTIFWTNPNEIWRFLPVLCCDIKIYINIFKELYTLIEGLLLTV